MGKAEGERRGRSWERGGERLRRTEEEESLEPGPAEGKKRRKRGSWRAENLRGKVLIQQGQEATQWTP